MNVNSDNSGNSDSNDDVISNELSDMSIGSSTKKKEKNTCLRLDKEKLVVGENHPTTLMTMICLANNYVHQDRLYDAEAIFKQVLDKQKVVLGENHPCTLKTMYLYSLIEQLNG